MTEKRQSVVVSIADSHLPNIHSVADSLRDAGLQVDNVLATLGIISGKMKPDTKQALEAIPGVVAIEPDEEMHAI